jgi:citronellol/citronellal dehydrogenase
MLPIGDHRDRLKEREVRRVSERRLSGQVVIVTGASRGLGQYCAVGFGREGATVVVAARTEEARNPNLPGTIYETARLVEEAGGEAFPVVCNVADAASIASAVEQVVARYGQVDVLVNNAGVLPAGLNSTIEPKHWELEFRVNVHGPFHCIRAAIPHMIERQQGNIINISSYASDGGSHYGATKRALEAMTVGFAQEQAGNGIAVNVLKPVVAIATPGMNYPTGGATGGQPRQGMVLMGPERYVEAAVLLAGQTPSTCTGQVYDDAQVVEKLGDAEARARFQGEEWPASPARA